MASLAIPPQGLGSSYQTSTITGRLDHHIDAPESDQHEELVVDVGSDHFEADINTYSNTGTDGFPGGSEAELAIRSRQVAQMPAEGLQTNTHFSYDDQKLKESDFTIVPQADLEKKLQALAEGSSEITLQGEAWRDPDGSCGIHDTHMNCGEIGSNPSYPNRDGLLQFYTKVGSGIQEDTVFIKFQSQRLGNPAGNNNSLLNHDLGNIAHP